MITPGRKFTAGYSYRYGFNGKEKDKDAGEGIQDYGMRIYDGRLGKFLSVDPLTHKYPNWSPYQFAGNSAIWAKDIDGLEPDKKTDPTVDNKPKEILLLEVVVKSKANKHKNRWSVGAPFPIGNFNYAHFKTLATNLPKGFSVEDYTSSSNFKNPFKWDELSSIYSPIAVTKYKDENTTVTLSINVNHYKFLIMNGDDYIYRFEGGLNEISFNKTVQSFFNSSCIEQNKTLGLKFGYFYGWGAGILASSAGIPHQIEGTGARAEPFTTPVIFLNGYQFAGYGANARVGAFLKITKYFQVQLGLQLHANRTIPIRAYDASGNVTIQQSYSSLGGGAFGGATLSFGL